MRARLAAVMAVVLFVSSFPATMYAAPKPPDPPSDEGPIGDEFIPDPVYVEPETVPSPPDTYDPRTGEMFSWGAEADLPGLTAGIYSGSVEAGGGKQRLGSGPVWLELAGGGNGPLEAEVEVLPKDLALGFSDFGTAIALRAGKGDILDGSLTIELDYSLVPITVGGGAIHRLKLVRWTGCSDVDDSGKRGVVCSGLQVLPGVNDPGARRVSLVVDEGKPVEPRVVANRPELAEVAQIAAEAMQPPERGFEFSTTTTVPPAPTSTSIPTSTTVPISDPSTTTTSLVSGDDSIAVAPTDEGVSVVLADPPEGALEPVGGDGFSILALSGGASGATGSFAASPFTSLADYQVGLFAGAAELSYEVHVPAPAAGPAPVVRLTYSSAAVDGMTASKNNQPGPVGIGWSLDLGSVTRFFKACDPPSTDTCTAGDEYSINLNGTSSRLVYDGVVGGDNVYLLASDPRWKVTRKSDGGTGHDDRHGIYFEVITPDGTKYLFGRQFESETGKDQKSVQYLWLKGGSCAGETNNLCKKGWRWDLDRVEDTSGNVISYFYEREFNEYLPYLLGDPIQYVRAAHPVRIEYTKRSGVAGGSVPNARVLFTWEIRCGNEDLAGDCTWTSDFVDTPTDLWCRFNTSDCDNSTEPQSYWSQLRLRTITTQILKSMPSGSGDGGWATTVTHDLAQTFPNYEGDGFLDPKLALYRIHRREGGSYETYAFTQIEAEGYDAESGTTIDPDVAQDAGNSRFVDNWDAGNWLWFDDVYFGGGSGIATEVLIRYNSTQTAGKLEFWKDCDSSGAGGSKIGEVAISDTSSGFNWNTGNAALIASTSGIHDLCVKASTGIASSLSLNWFRFKTADMTTIPDLRSVNFAASDSGAGYNDDFTFLENRQDHGSGSPMMLPRIKEVENELGGVVAFTYGQPAGCKTTSGGWEDNTTHCFPEQVEYNDETGVGHWRKWVVTQITSNPTYGGSSTETYAYDYHGEAQWRLDNLPTRTNHFRSDFRGHNIVTVTDQFGDTTEHRFFQGKDNDPDAGPGGTIGPPRDFNVQMRNGDYVFEDKNWLAGREYETVVEEAVTTNNFLQTRTWFHADQNAGPTTTPEEDWGAWFVALSKILSITADGVDRTAEVQYEYDGDGNVTTELLYGDNSTSSDNRMIVRSFAKNTSSWIVNTPKEEILYEGAPTPGAVLSKTRWLYDGGAYGVAPTDGDVTELQAFTSISAYNRTLTTYDSYGRPTLVEQVLPGTGAVNRRTKSVYDATHGYVTEVRRKKTIADDPADHVTTTAYEAFARPATVTDANGNATSLKYDSFGRLTEVERPGDGPDATIKYSYSITWPARVRTQQRVDTSTVAGGGIYVDSYSWVDGFGRQIQTQSPVQTTGMRSVGSISYDALGRVEYQSQPYELSGEPATGGSNGYMGPSWTTVWAYTKSYFDPAGRPIKTESKHLNTVEFDTEISYDGWESTLLDGADNRTDQNRDAFGNVVLVEEYSSPTAVYATTSYGYDKANRLTSVTDTSNNTTVIGYDFLGLKQTMSDPDTGNWEYDYNEAGELTRQQDGRGKQMFFEYDAWGRTTKKRKDNATGPLVAEWSYDGSIVINNVTYTFKGLLASSKAYVNVGTVNSPVNGTVEVKYPTYDSQDRVTKQEWWVGKTASTWDKMVQTFSYTANGSSWKVKYPSNLTGGMSEELTTAYSSRSGEPVSLTSSAGSEVYVDSATYTAWGAPLRQTFGGAAHDELRRSWVYDDLNRLFKVRAGKGPLGSGDPAPGDVNLVHLHMYYDAAQNIREMVDWRNTDQVQCFAYDHRNRLYPRAYTRAEIVGTS